MKTALRFWGYQAYVDGLQKGAGNTTILPDTEERAEAETLINGQIGYVRGLRDYVFSDPSPSFVDILSRATLWASKGLDSLYNAGLLAGRGNKMLEWRIGHRRKSCQSCLAANGQRHRAKDWKRRGIEPKADGLECKGFQCGCEFIETNLPAFGRLDRIPFGIFGKKKHYHRHYMRVKTA